MSVAATPVTESTSTGESRSAHRIVDCDVHPYFSDGLKDLVPYLPEAIRYRLGLHHTETWLNQTGAFQFRLPTNDMYINMSMRIRGDAARDGEVPGSNPAFVAEHLFDTHGIDRGILTGANTAGIGAVRDPDIAAALASAWNDWISERWLDADERYRGSILVAPQDPVKAAAEIHRVADRPGFVQVQLPPLDILMGERHWYPMYEAAVEHGLPVAVHPSATESIFQRAPMLGGVPTYYLEWHVGLTIPNQSNVLSLVAHGVFERFPTMKYVLVEGGFAWAIDLLWRLDRDWAALRAEVPWVKRPPSEYVFEHVRFTTQPFYEPAKREHLVAVLDALRAEETLMFSSDYPHWDFDDPSRALKLVPKEARERIYAGNAIELYGSRLD